MKHKKIIISAALSFTVLLTSFAAAIVMPQMQPKAKYLSVADIQGIVDQITSEEAVATEVIEIDPYLANAVDTKFEEIWTSNKLSGGDSQVSQRDWDKYKSDTPKANMTYAEATFYDRLDDIAERFLTDSSADAVYMSIYDLYAMSGVAFSDLGLSKQDAYRIAEWFLYNNPQYYFLRPKFLTTSSAFYLSTYDFGWSGVKRADVTDTMFDTFDEWIYSVNDDEVTIYQTEMSAHRLLCTTLSYQQSAYDQSVYSSVFYNKTVCAGYSGAFQIICNASGIDCVTALSTAHAWNLIQLEDGNWYAVDLTWNDSLDGYYIFNSGASSSCKYDSKNEHVSDALWTRWSPNIASADYIPTVYDTTGSHNAPMTLESPVNLQSYFNSDTSATISWDYVQNATGYDVEVYTGLSLVGQMRVSAEYVQLNNIQQYTDIEIKVRSTATVDGFTYASAWSEYTLYPQHVILPHDIKVDLVDSIATITWEGYDNRTYEFEFYSNENYTDLLTRTAVDTRTLVIRNLKPEYEYFGRVRTVRNNNGMTERSDWVNFDIKANQKVDDVPVVPDKPDDPVQPSVPKEDFTISAPSKLSSDMISKTMCSINWNKVNNALYYEIKASTDAAGNNCVVSATVTGTSVTLNNVVAEYDYYFHIRAVGTNEDKTYYSDWETILMHAAEKQDNVPSTPVQPQPESPDIPDEPVSPSQPEVPDNFTLSIPSGLNANMISDSMCSINWNSVSDADHYEIKASIDPDGNDCTVNTDFSGTSVTLNNVVAEYDYYFHIRAVANRNGQVYYSDWAKILMHEAEMPDTPVQNGTTEQDVPTTSDISVYSPSDLNTVINDNVCFVSWTNTGSISRTDLEVSLYDDFRSVFCSSPVYGDSIGLGNVVSGWTYYVRVRSVKIVDGQEYYSDWVCSQFAK